MKIIRSTWVLLVNAFLILLPWLALGLLVVYFGQSTVAIYKSYFSGDPVREIRDLTRDLHENPDREIPFKDLQRHYIGLTAVKTINDTEARVLRESTLQIHRSIVLRIRSNGLSVPTKTFLQSYDRLLNTEFLASMFASPKLVREKLLSDVRRLLKLRDFPYNPGRNLESFASASDTTINLIQSYGQIYADQVTCKQVFKSSCDYVYDPSVIFLAERISQFLQAWPDLPLRTTPTINDFSTRVPLLIEGYSDLTQEVQGYFTSAPWNQFDEIKVAFRRFETSFNENIAKQYTKVLDGFSLKPRQFSNESPPGEIQKLQSLIKTENFIRENPTAQNLLFQNESLAKRTELSEKLQQVYLWVVSHDQFESGFTASADGLGSIETAIKKFPDGVQKISAVQERLKSATTMMDRLKEGITKRDYTALVADLRSVQDDLNSTNSILWQVLVRQFISQVIDEITNPSWQPSGQDGMQEYQELITLIGELGTSVDVSRINEQWADQTLLALKSRRFNQIEHELLNMLSELTDSNTSKVTRLLSELLGIENLPGELRDRSREILFKSILLERISLSSTKLYQQYFQRLNDNEKNRELWQTLQSVMNPIETSDEWQIFNELNLADYLNRLSNWLSNFESNKRLNKLISSELTARIQDTFGTLLTELLDTVQNPQRKNSSAKQLFSRVREMNEALKKGQKLDGFDLVNSIDRWENLMKFRVNIESIESRIKSISSGSLFGGNTNFEKLKGELSTIEITKFPPEYDLAHERKLLTELHQLILSKAQSLRKSNQDSWFSGWGGRITGIELLKVWERFLQRIEQRFPQTPIANKAMELYESSLDRRGNW